MLATTTNLVVLANVLLVCFFAPTAFLIHELGHAIAAKCLGWSIHHVTLGCGKPMLRFSVGRTQIEINRYLVTGNIRVSPKNNTTPHITADRLICLSGPAANIVTAAITIMAISNNDATNLFNHISGATVFAITNFLVAITTLIPVKMSRKVSDGRQLLRSRTAVQDRQNSALTLYCLHRAKFAPHIHIQQLWLNKAHRHSNNHFDALWMQAHYNLEQGKLSTARMQFSQLTASLDHHRSQQAVRRRIFVIDFLLQDKAAPCQVDKINDPCFSAFVDCALLLCEAKPEKALKRLSSVDKKNQTYSPFCYHFLKATTYQHLRQTALMKVHLDIINHQQLSTNQVKMSMPTNALAA